MAFSTQSVTSDGTLVLIDITFDYIARNEVSVFFDSVPTTDWSWVGDNEKKIAFSPAVPMGVEVLVKRTTDISGLRHEFSLGAAFTYKTLDEDLKQVLHIAQEASEANFVGDFFVPINMHTNRITELAPGIADTDAVTVGQLAPFAVAAEASADAASDSAVGAALSEAAAAVSAAAALVSETNAAASALAADADADFIAGSVATAVASAAAAEVSEDNAAASAAASQVSRLAAEAAQNAASASAFDAAASEVAAAASQVAAAASESAVIATVANFAGRNKIINGKMEILQRGTPFTSPASGAYTLDRWVWGNTSSGAVTISHQSADSPSSEFRSSLRVTVTTADASLAAGDFAYVGQRIEGYNVRDLIGKDFTVSFWVRSSKVGTHTVAFRNATSDRSQVKTYTVSVANTWEKKSFLVTGGLITAGTWDWTNGAGLYVDFLLAAGSTYQTTANAWQTGNFLGVSGAVNCMDTIGNVFAMTGVQLEVGAVATPFEHRLHGQELALCQRYFVSFSASSFRVISYGAAGGALHSYKLPVAMRTTPTVTQPSNFNQTNITGTTLSGGNELSVRVSGSVTTLGSYSYEDSGTAATASAEL